MGADNREKRPRIDMLTVRATVAGLSSEKWRDRRHYTSLLDPFHDRAVRRETPLPESDERLAAHAGA